MAVLDDKSLLTWNELPGSDQHELEVDKEFVKHALDKNLMKRLALTVNIHPFHNERDLFLI